MDKGIIFNIQRYSLHDGGGIRTIVFFKGCPLRCQWCSNPESQEINPQIIFNQDKCIDCGRCFSVCPTGARKGKGKCILCGRCVKVCPTEAMEIIGREMSISEVIQEVEKDSMFYGFSDGGVTLSGGEPLMQWQFAEALISELKARYYHVAIETAGYAKWEYAERVYSKCDLILYDIKHMDSEFHKKYVGVPNDLILENAEKAARMNLNVIFRVPIIGGINNSEKNINMTAKFAKRIGVKKIHLLPYHRLGENKYAKLGRKYQCKGYIPSDQEMEKLKDIVQRQGIIAQIGG